MHKTVSGLEMAKFLQSKGFSVYSRKGSHVKMISKERHAKTIVPMHGTISIGTLNAIFRQAKLSEEEILEVLEK